MAIFSKQALKTLIDQPKQSGFSIYMPTHRMQDTAEDSIRLKNLLRVAEQKLVQNGVRIVEARKLTSPAEAWLPDMQFWQHQSDGLAIFSSPGFYQQYRMPYQFPELVYAGTRFHIKPLLTFLTGNGLFYILAVSQRRVRLLQCTANSYREVTPDAVPPNIAEAMKFDFPEKATQYHTGSAITVGGASQIHGSSNPKGDTKDEIVRYMEQIDRAIEALLANEDAPVVFAGVEFLEPIFRKTIHYRRIMDRGIQGNPDIVSDQMLQKQGWAIMKPYFASQETDALNRYCVAKARNYATNDLKECLKSAFEGRVDSLFVDMGKQVWGTYDPNELKMEVHNEEKPGDEDLLDLAAIYTLQRNGSVYPLKPEQIPGVPPIAAMYRF